MKKEDDSAPAALEMILQKRLRNRQGIQENHNKHLRLKACSVCTAPHLSGSRLLHMCEPLLPMTADEEAKAESTRVSRTKSTPYVNTAAPRARHLLMLF